MSPSEEATFVEAFKKHGERLQLLGEIADIPVTFHWSTAVKLVSQLQLVLRHPENKGDSRDAARRLVDILIMALDQSSPGVGELLRRGDDPACDVKTGVKP